MAAGSQARRSAPRIGVLALQGDVREHLRILESLGARGVPVRRESELAAVDGLVLPGGESTTIIKLAVAFDLLEPLRAAVKEGLPVYGSCAGMILLADRLTNGGGADGIDGQQTIGGLDVLVRRNAFGRQVDSFEADLDAPELAEPDRPFHAVFIRAPWVEEVGREVTVLARAGEHVVAVRQGPLMATSFHPELTGDDRVHQYFLDLVRDV
ncbi:MAG TPA: pyridoxal 5'-phosphate synthase glutaminase subunit PdxT [Sporichthya sp.]|nr:pyridoxal 5'-phosphate synthase glutaminase subunit PdxT [Sporichthya sp.]